MRTNGKCNNFLFMFMLLCPNEQFFRKIVMFPCLSGLNQARVALGECFYLALYSAF